MLKILELFAGIGAASKALTNLGIDHEIVDAVEIDKYAMKAFNAIHGTNFETQDITKWNKDIQCDLILHGSPCQDFSAAGLQAGGDKGSGTRSSLMYETLRIVEKLRPKYVIWENVKNLLSKKHRHNFDAYLEQMEKLGYQNYYQVLNAKDYGVPQNRERVFTVSILGGGKFMFPETIPLEKKLKDILEPEVDEKYYLDSRFDKLKMVNNNYGMMEGGVIGKMHDSSRRAYSSEYVSPTIPTCTGGNIQPKVIEGATPLQREVCDRALEKGLVEPNDAIEYTYSNARLREIERGHIKKQNKADNQVMSTLKTNPQQIGVVVSNQGKNVDKTTDIATTIMARDYKGFGNQGMTGVCVPIKTANKKGYDLAENGDGIDLAYPDSKTRRGRVGHGIAKTIPTNNNQGVLDNYRIRKLTPRECYRLMGFDDKDFEKASKEISNTQLYKTAGNSIVVDVLEAIFKELLYAESRNTV